MSEKKNWSVKMKCTVIKRVYLEQCTEKEATSQPWEYATEEFESDQHDWEILKIEEAD